MSTLAHPGDKPRGRNRALFTRLGIVAVFMFGFGYALVPFYNQICRATGLRELGGLDGERDTAKNTQVDATRTVRVELDSNLRGLAWTFKPETPIVDVHPGAVTQVLFDVTNTTDHAITGQAIPSYSPANAVRYFHKLECFCFTRQTLAPGEHRQMPVVFVLDPTMPKDMPTVSLSYTFFAVEGAN